MKVIVEENLLGNEEVISIMEYRIICQLSHIYKLGRTFQQVDGKVLKKQFILIFKNVICVGRNVPCGANVKQYSHKNYQMIKVNVSKGYRME